MIVVKAYRMLTVAVVEVSCVHREGSDGGSHLLIRGSQNVPDGGLGDVARFMADMMTTLGYALDEGDVDETDECGFV